MTTDNVEKVNQEVQQLLASAMSTPSFSTVEDHSHRNGTTSYLF